MIKQNKRPIFPYCSQLKFRILYNFSILKSISYGFDIDKIVSQSLDDVPFGVPGYCHTVIHLKPSSKY